MCVAIPLRQKFHERTGQHPVHPCFLCQCIGVAITIAIIAICETETVSNLYLIMTIKLMLISLI